MPGREEALRVDHQLAIAAPRDDRADGLGGLFRQPAARGDHGDAHAQRLWLDRAPFGNGRPQLVRRLRAGCSFFAVFAVLAAWRSLATGFVFLAFSSFLTGFAACRSFVRLLPFDPVALASFAL